MRQVTVTEHLLLHQQESPMATGRFTSLLNELILSAKIISREVNKAGLVDVLGLTGETNVQGEAVRKLDEYANSVLIHRMQRSGVLCAIGSEENADLFGQVDVMCDQTTNTAPQIASGRVKAFAVTSGGRLSVPPLLKNYPSLQEVGLSGFKLTIWHALYAPKGTPAPVLKQLNEALKQALKNPDFIRKQEALGALVVTDQRQEPAGHKAFVAAEIAKLKPLIEASGQFAD